MSQTRGQAQHLRHPTQSPGCRAASWMAHRSLLPRTSSLPGDCVRKILQAPTGLLSAWMTQWLCFLAAHLSLPQHRRLPESYKSSRAAGAGCLEVRQHGVLHCCTSLLTLAEVHNLWA